jgi:hypothetical protein
MLRKIDTAIEGIGSAIEKGMKQRTRSEKEIAKRKNALLETSRKVDILGARLSMIRKSAQGGSE